MPTPNISGGIMPLIAANLIDPRPSRPSRPSRSPARSPESSQPSENVHPDLIALLATRSRRTPPKVKTKAPATAISKSEPRPKRKEPAQQAQVQQAQARELERERIPERIPSSPFDASGLAFSPQNMGAPSPGREARQRPALLAKSSAAATRNTAHRRSEESGIFSIKDHELAERYLFEKEIGFGNWGSVWTCYSKRGSSGSTNTNGQVLAVKLCHRQRTQPSNARVRSLWNEFKVLRTIKSDWHPSVVRPHEFIITPSYALMFMPYYNQAMNVALPQETCRSYFQGLLSGVFWLHSHHISHNDIKVANILLSFDETRDTRVTPILVDFGFANLYDPSKTYAYQSNQSWGTPEYLAPERARGDLHDERVSDIWSLGVTFFEIATGRTPFEHDEEQFLTKDELEVYYHRTMSGTWIGSWTISPQLEDLIKSMLVPSPKKRVEAADALLHPFFDPLTSDCDQSLDDLLDADELSSLQASTPLRKGHSKRSPSPSSTTSPTSPGLSAIGNVSQVTDLIRGTPPWAKKRTDLGEDTSSALSRANTDVFVKRLQHHPRINDQFESPSPSKDGRACTPRTELETLQSPSHVRAAAIHRLEASPVLRADRPALNPSKYASPAANSPLRSALRNAANKANIAAGPAQDARQPLFNPSTKHKEHTLSSSLHAARAPRSLAPTARESPMRAPETRSRVEAHTFASAARSKRLEAHVQVQVRRNPSLSCRADDNATQSTTVGGNYRQKKVPGRPVGNLAGRRSEHSEVKHGLARSGETREKKLDTVTERTKPSVKVEPKSSDSAAEAEENFDFDEDRAHRRQERDSRPSTGLLTTDDATDAPGDDESSDDDLSEVSESEDAAVDEDPTERPLPYRQRCAATPPQEQFDEPTRLTAMSCSFGISRQSPSPVEAPTVTRSENANASSAQTSNLSVSDANDLVGRLDQVGLLAATISRIVQETRLTLSHVDVRPARAVVPTVAADADLHVDVSSPPPFPLVTLTPRHQQELQMPIAIPAQPSPRYTPRASDTDGDADAQTVPQPPASPLERRGRLATEYQDVEESSRPSVDDTDQSTSSVPFPRQSSPLGGQQANPKPSTPASHPARLRRVSFRESIDLHSITPLNSMDEARSPQPSDAATQCHCCASHAQQTQAQAPPHSQGKAAPSIAVSESGNEADDEPDDLESAADTSREVIQKLVNDCNVNVLMPAFAPSSDDEDLHARAARKAARGRRRASPNATPKRRKEDKRNAIANAPTPRSQRKIESVYSAYLLADGTVTRKGKGFEGVGPSIVEKPGTLFQLPSLRRQTSLASASLRGRALKDVAEAQRLAVESSYEGSSSGAMPKHGPPTTPSNSTLWKKLRGFGAARLPKEMQRTV